MLALCPRCPPSVVPSGPLGSFRFSPPSPPYSWRRGLLLAELWAGSVSWGPLRPSVSLAARTCQSARHGSGGSIPASIPASGGGGGVHSRRGCYCSLVLVALWLLFIWSEQKQRGKLCVFFWWRRKNGSPREYYGSRGWSGCGQHGASSRAPSVPEPGRPAAAAAATAFAALAELRRPRG